MASVRVLILVYFHNRGNALIKCMNCASILRNQSQMYTSFVETPNTSFSVNFLPKGEDMYTCFSPLMWLFDQPTCDIPSFNQDVIFNLLSICELFAAFLSFLCTIGIVIFSKEIWFFGKNSICTLCDQSLMGINVQQSLHCFPQVWFTIPMKLAWIILHVRLDRAYLSCCGLRTIFMVINSDLKQLSTVTGRKKSPIYKLNIPVQVMGSIRWDPINQTKLPSR